MPKFLVFETMAKKTQYRGITYLLFSSEVLYIWAVQELMETIKKEGKGLI